MKERGVWLLRTITLTATFSDVVEIRSRVYIVLFILTFSIYRCFISRSSYKNVIYYKVLKYSKFKDFAARVVGIRGLLLGLSLGAIII